MLIFYSRSATDFMKKVRGEDFDFILWTGSVKTAPSSLTLSSDKMFNSNIYSWSNDISCIRTLPTHDYSKLTQISWKFRRIVASEWYFVLCLRLEYFLRIQLVFIFMHSNTNNGKQKYLYNQNRSICAIKTKLFVRSKLKYLYTEKKYLYDQNGSICFIGTFSFL